MPDLSAAPRSAGLDAGAGVPIPPPVPAVPADGPWRRFLRHRLAVFGFALFLLLLIAAFGGQHWWHYRYDDLTGAYSEPPSAAHPFGTDSSGHDVLAQVLRGTARSMEVALMVGGLSTLIGAWLGALAGYYRGRVDGGLMRLVDLVLILPLYAVAALLGHQVGSSQHGWFGIGLVLALLLWAPIARVVRGVTLSVVESDYIEAARGLGASNRWILTRHILPNVSGPIIVNATVCVAVAVLAETALSYVGFGVQPPDVSLGSLVAAAQAASSTRWWLFYCPGAVLILLVLAVNFIGDGLRDALDPAGARRPGRLR